MKKVVLWSGRFAEKWFAFSGYLFVLLLGLNLLLVFSLDFFFTGDGPAHLYNSNLILQLLGNESPATDFFELRKALIPNMGAHALLVLFNSVLEAAMAEKIVMGLCLILLPLAAFYLLSVFDKKQTAFVFLLFPFAHNFCLYIGFQSFCLGLSLGLVALGYFLRRSRAPQKWWAYVGLSLLLFCTAFFHVVALMITAVTIGVVMLLGLLSKRMHWNAVGYTLLSLLPAILFCGYFVVQNSGGGFVLNTTPFSDLLYGVLHNSALITLSVLESRFINPFSILLVVSVLWVVVERLRSGWLWKMSDFALLVTLLCFVLYFVFPNEMASGGFVSVRMLLYAFLFLALWIGFSLKRTAITAVFMCVAVWVHLRVLYYHYGEAKLLSKDASLIYEAAMHITEGSTLVPMNYSDHWLHYNIGLYAGAERSIVVLDNYEASTTHFPVVWKEEAFPGDGLGNFGFSNRPYLKISPYEKCSGHRVDAVLRWRHRAEMTDSATLVTNQVLDSLFTRTYLSEDGEVELYLRKQ